MLNRSIHSAIIRTCGWCMPRDTSCSSRAPRAWGGWRRSWPDSPGPRGSSARRGRASLQGPDAPTKSNWWFKMMSLNVAFSSDGPCLRWTAPWRPWPWWPRAPAPWPSQRAWWGYARPVNWCQFLCVVCVICVRFAWQLNVMDSIFPPILVGKIKSVSCGTSARIWRQANEEMLAMSSCPTALSFYQTKIISTFPWCLNLWIIKTTNIPAKSDCWTEFYTTLFKPSRVCSKNSNLWYFWPLPISAFSKELSSKMVSPNNLCILIAY